jgi:hypothetical protein
MAAISSGNHHLFPDVLSVNVELIHVQSKFVVDVGDLLHQIRNEQDA